VAIMVYNLAGASKAKKKKNTNIFANSWKNNRVLSR